MATYNGKTTCILNLRSSTSTSSTLIAQIPESTILSVSTINGNDSWFSTTYNGNPGYVYARYVEVTDAGATCFVHASSLNIRLLPSTSSTKLYVAAGGAVLQLLDAESVAGWYRVSSASGTGWGSASFLTIQESSGSEEEEMPEIDFDNMSFSLGDEGEDVWKYVNEALGNHHYAPGLSSDRFTYATQWAIKYFQSRNGLQPTGVADPATLKKLHGLSGTVTKGVSDAVINRSAEGPAVEDIKMNNPLWSGVVFDADNTAAVETIGDSGNAPTAIAIAFSTLCRSAFTPPAICDETLSRNLRDHDGVTGVTADFYQKITVGHDVVCLDSTTDLETIRRHCAAGGIAVTRLTYNSTYPYCTVNGATHVVVYKVDSGFVYLVNSNAGSNAPIPVDVWNANWVKNTWLYILG